MRIRQLLAGTAMTAALLVSGAAGAEQPSDAWITTKVKMSLLTADTVDGLDIDVDTFDGRVTLHGVVASQGEREAAEKRTEAIDGVLSVRNLLAVVPDDRAAEVAVSDERLGDQVRTVLERDAALEAARSRWNRSTAASSCWAAKPRP